MKRVHYYEVTLSNRQETEFKETFGFVPSVVHITEALQQTALAMLNSAETETDPLDKEKLLDEANEFDLLKQLLPILDDAYVDQAISQNGNHVHIAVAGTPVGSLVINVRSMLSQSSADEPACYAAPAPDEIPF